MLQLEIQTELKQYLLENYNYNYKNSMELGVNRIQGELSQEKDRKHME